jgi:hypothetical protein
VATKHRKQGQRARKIALVGAASATATCLTVGAAPPPAPHHAVSSVPVALAADIDYTQLITDSSNSFNNILFASANFQNGLADLFEPLLAATGGSAGATVGQANLLQLLPPGVLQALIQILGTFNSPAGLSGVPGLPAGAGSILNPVLDGTDIVTLPVLGTLTGLLTALQGVLTAVSGITTPLGVTVPSLDQLIPGLTATLTTYESHYNLPLLGLGTLLGLSGQSTATNLFAQIPGLTPEGLVDGILDGLTGSVAALAVAKPLVNTLLTLGPVSDLLNLVNTPTVTAWVPLAGGTYGLPLGGQFGFLATMPTLDVGPVDLAPDLLPPLSTTDTVLAVPIGAAGVDLPLGLASFGMLGTPGIVLPTATGVTTVGGVSLTSFSIPGLGISYLSTNVQGANYYGTNGIDFSDGQNIGALVTPLGTIPIIYSLGSFNVGDDGFGFSGPSFFGVGLIPPIQVGDAPTQQSPDGLIPANGLVSLNTLFTAGRALSPTQLTSVTEVLGIPNVGQSLADAVLTPGYQILVTPLATQLTAYLNANLGSWVNGGASQFEQLTAAIANLSAQIPGATPIPAPAVTPAAQNNALLETASVQNKQAAPVVHSQQTIVQTQASTDPVKNVQNEVRSANTQITTSITAANAKTKASVAKATADIEKSVEKAGAKLNKIAKDGQDQVKKAVEGVQKTVKAAGDSVGNAAKAATKKADKK